MSEPMTKSPAQALLRWDRPEGFSRDEWNQVVDQALAEARAALLDELEAAVRGLPLKQVWEYRKAPRDVVERDDIYALIQQHREGNP
jgi:hypothetical protein